MPEEPGHASDGSVTWISPELFPGVAVPEEGWIVTPSSVLEAAQSSLLADVKLTIHCVDDPNRLPLQLTEDEPLHW